MTNNNYLDHIGDWNTQTPVTKLSTSYKAFEYKHHNFDPAGNGGQGSFTGTTVYRVNYEGTNFDEVSFIGIPRRLVVFNQWRVQDLP